MDDKLSTLALVVAVTVVLCIAFTFGVLFTLYSAARIRGIKGGAEDENIVKELKRRYLGKDTGENKNGKNAHGAPYVPLTESQKEEVRTAYAKRRRRVRIGTIISNVVFILAMIVIVAVSAVAISFRAGGGQFFIHDTAYLVVKTQSMSYKNENNPYCDQLPDNQISAYTLISVKKLSDDYEIQLYDIIAYVNDGTTYVHRVVEIDSSDGETVYTAMGDANTGSFTFETALKRSSIIGVYTGFNSFACGVACSYFQSDIGIIALAFVFLFLAAADLSLGRVDANLEKRITFLLAPDRNKGAAERENAEEDNEGDEEEEDELAPAYEYDGAKEIAPFPASTSASESEAPRFAPAEQPAAPEEQGQESSAAEQDGRYVNYRYRRSFTAKLIQSGGDAKNYYSALKNELLSYGLKSRTSWKYETFRRGRKALARLQIRGRTLCLCLAQDGSEQSGSYKAEDNAHRPSLADTPLVYRIKSARACKNARRLISVLMSGQGLERRDMQELDYAASLVFEDDVQLLSKGLIKPVGGKK